MKLLKIMPHFQREKDIFKIGDLILYQGQALIVILKQYLFNHINCQIMEVIKNI